MAPTKTTSTSNRLISKDAVSVIASLIPRKGLTRDKNIQGQNGEEIQMRPTKRKADINSPIKNDKIKRSALGNLTNNANKQHPEEDSKQKSNLEKKAEKVIADGAVVLGAVPKITTRATSKKAKNENLEPVGASKKVDADGVAATHHFEEETKQKLHLVKKSQNVAADAAVALGAVPKITTRATTKKAKTVTKLKPPPLLPPAKAEAATKVKAQHKSRRISNEFNQTEDSLYMSALEDISSCESRLSGKFEAAKRRSMLLQQQQQKQQKETDPIKTETKDAEIESDDGRYKDILSPMILPMPSDVEDFDKINLNDPFQVSHYAMDIFNYLKMREEQFIIDDYMTRQVHLSKYMRSLLVDWMVEVQETFELNHETLYLAVKIVDLFLCKVIINKERLQLLGAASLFIACKFDERTPPLVEDFLYICDGAYKHNELIEMEMTVLRNIDYDLGIPLSYRFLRRYARCAKISMPTLTLARYVLELSLMDYETVGLSDSRLACATLFIALRMQGEQKVWSSTLEHFTGYKLVDFADILPILNDNLHRRPKGTIKNIRNKYSHKIFHEVAKIDLLSTDQLLEHELDIRVNLCN